MATTVDADNLFFGAPASLTVGGTEVGATLTAPKATVQSTQYAPDFQGAGGPVAEAVFITKIEAAVEFDVNEVTGAKLAWSMPGSTSVVGTGATHTTGHSQTLPADTAAAATVIKFTGIAVTTSSEADDIIDTTTAHGFTAGQRIKFETITGGTGLVAGTTYFVLAANLAATTLQVSLTLAGAAELFSTNITAGILIPAYTAGEFLKVGDTGETEIRSIVTVGTSSLGGNTGLTLSAPLVFAHDAGDAILEVDDAGTTITTWRTGRVPASAFKTVILDGIGVDGRHLKVTVTDALSDGKLSIEMSDSAVAGSHVVMTGYYAGADPTLCPVQIEVG